VFRPAPMLADGGISSMRSKINTLRCDNVDERVRSGVEPVVGCIGVEDFHSLLQAGVFSSSSTDLIHEDGELTSIMSN
jgi:hypothetical protein